MHDTSNGSKLKRVSPDMEKKVRNLLEKTDLKPIAHSANLQIEIVNSQAAQQPFMSKKIELEARKSIEAKKSP